MVQTITALAVVLALAAAVFDVRERRIPNRLTYSFAVLGLVVQSASFGWSGLLASLFGGLVFGGIFLLFHVVRAMGAGDVKLAAALGFVVGVPAALQVMFATAIWGGVLAIVYMVVSGRIWVTMRNTFAVVGHHLRHGLQAHPEVNLDNPTAGRLPYGLAFAAGTLHWALFPLLWR